MSQGWQPASWSHPSFCGPRSPQPPAHCCSLTGLLIAPLLIERFGWPSVFYLFGGLGLVWALWWERLVAGIAEREPELVQALTTPGGAGANPQQQQKGARLDASSAAAAAHDDGAALAGHGGHGGVIDARAPVPWRAFLRSPALLALGYTHYCNNWCGLVGLSPLTSAAICTPLLADEGRHSASLGCLSCLQ